MEAVKGELSMSSKFGQVLFAKIQFYKLTWSPKATATVQKHFNVTVKPWFGRETTGQAQVCTALAVRPVSYAPTEVISTT